MNGKSMLAAFVVTSMLLPIIAMVMVAPTASALKVTATADENSVHVVIDVTITIGLDEICNTWENYMRRYKPDWNWEQLPGNVGPWTPGGYGTAGLTASATETSGTFDISAMPSSRAEAMGYFENAFNKYRDMYTNYGEDFRAAYEKLCEDSIKAMLANSDVADLKVTYEQTKEGNKITIKIHIEFTLKGTDVIYSEATGEAGINCKWRGLVVSGKTTVGNATVDYTQFKPIDISCFKVPLEQWTKSAENDRLVLTKHVAKHDIDLSFSIAEQGCGVKITIDPEATLVGPVGSAGATVSGDKIVLTAAEKPLLERPEVLAAVAIVAIVIVGGLIAVARRRK